MPRRLVGQRRAQKIKALLILAVVGLTAGLFILSDPSPKLMQPVQEKDDVSMEVFPGLDTDKPSLHDVASTVLEDPRFIGRDQYDRKWEVKARLATQGRQYGGIQLHEVVAEVYDAQGRHLNLAAKAGLYDDEKHQVLLSDGVEISGFEFVAKLPEVRYNMKEGTAEAKGPVRIDGKPGWLQADKLQMVQNGKRLRLTGHVRLHLNMAKGG